MCTTRIPLVPLCLGIGLSISPAVRAEVATEAETRTVCQNWLAYIVHQNGTWSGEAEPRIGDVQEIVAGDTVMARVYPINPQGYVVVPVLKELPPVKAYSEEYDLDVNQAGGFPQLLREVLEHRIGVYINRYGSLEASQPRTEEPLFDRVNRQEWDRLLVDTTQFAADLAAGSRTPGTGAGPLLATEWHQGAPYNNVCPMGDGGRTIVGCVATATAQVMRYWQHPPTGNALAGYFWDGDDSCPPPCTIDADCPAPWGSCDTSAGECTGCNPCHNAQNLTANLTDAYDWANMPDDCTAGCTAVEQAALAELSYEVGFAYRMDYGRCGSGAGTPVAVLRDTFNYDPAINRQNRNAYNPATWFNLIQAEINTGRPMLYGISRHLIVCDGWQVYNGENFYHMNYGWGGAHSVWFAIDHIHCAWEGCDPLIESLVQNIQPPGATLNQPPICDTGGPYTVDCLGKLMLDGRNSSDPEDGDVASYRWWLGDCPAGTRLGAANTANPVLHVDQRTWLCEATCTVWLEVTDSEGITSQCREDVTIVDNEAPLVTGPQNQRLACGPIPPPAALSVQATDCNNFQARFLRDVSNGGGGCPGDPLIVSRTYRVTDDCGNWVDWVQTFTVVDDQAPVIGVGGFPADADLQCRGETPKPDTDLVTATDNCGGVEVTWEGDTKNNGIGCPGDPLIIWRTYRVTDDCGNYVERIQQFKIVDDVPPTFSEFPADENLQCITELPDPDTGLIEATDNCPGPVEITWEGDVDNGGKGCTGDPLIVTRTYRATDQCGNYAEKDQTFRIVDREAPTIECSITNDVQPVEVDENCEAYIEFSVTVTNNCCVDPLDVKINAYVVTGNATLGPIELDPLPPIAASVTVTGRVKVSDLICCPATVQLTADATDCCDHPAPQCVATVDVIDNYPPAGACGLTHDHPGCNFMDNTIELTANEPSYWSALSGQPKGTVPFDTLDPGWLPGRPDPDSVDSGDRVLRGYVVAWAVNEFGEEIRWNHLKGDAVLVNYGDGSAWEYSAYAFQARNVVHGALTGTPGVLHLDGAEYDTGFDQLLLDFYAVGATALSGETQTFTVDTDLTLLPLDIDLTQDNDGPVTTKAKFDIWNMNEWKFSGTERCITCWDQALLGNYDAPNHFLLRSIQTDKGKARIDGLASPVCPDSKEASLLGVAMKMLAFDGDKGAARAGMNLVGAGAQQGMIQADVLGEPPKTRRSDRRGAKDASTACSEPTSNVEKGSVLIFPKVEIRWDWCGKLIQDTFIDLTNDYPDDVLVQMYFVNGDPPAPAALPRCVGP